MDERDTVWARVHANGTIAVVLLRGEKYGVKAGANPNEPPIGRVAARTPLMTTSYKDASVAEALLKAGARLEDIDDGRTRFGTPRVPATGAS